MVVNFREIISVQGLRVIQNSERKISMTLPLDPDLVELLLKEDNHKGSHVYIVTSKI